MGAVWYLISGFESSIKNVSLGALGGEFVAVVACSNCGGLFDLLLMRCNRCFVWSLTPCTVLLYMPA